MHFRRNLMKKILSLSFVLLLFLVFIGCEGPGAEGSGSDEINDLPSNWTKTSDTEYIYQVNNKDELYSLPNNLSIREIDYNSDYTVEYEISRTGGDLNEVAGIVLSFSEYMDMIGSGYRLGINCQQEYTFIATTQDSVEYPVSQDIMVDRAQSSELISGFGAVNRVKVVYTAATQEFDLYMNNTFSSNFDASPMLPFRELALWVGYPNIDADDYPIIVKFKQIQ